MQSASITPACISNIKIYKCDACDYATPSKRDYSKHVTTQKHLFMETNSTKYSCCRTCKKQYISMKSLQKHELVCGKYSNLDSSNIAPPVSLGAIRLPEATGTSDIVPPPVVNKPIPITSTMNHNARIAPLGNLSSASKIIGGGNSMNIFADSKKIGNNSNNNTADKGVVVVGGESSSNIQLSAPMNMFPMATTTTSSTNPTTNVTNNTTNHKVQHHINVQINGENGERRFFDDKMLSDLQTVTETEDSVTMNKILFMCIMKQNVTLKELVTKQEQELRELKDIFVKQNLEMQNRFSTMSQKFGL